MKGPIDLATVVRVGVRTVLVIALVSGAIAVWSTFAPTALGGSSAYVVTEGESMLPRFEANGLVITRESNRYEVGDVVAYHNRELNAVVMHRIVGRHGGRYVFKGDNNDFLDHYRPLQTDLVGKEWVYWPELGRHVTSLRSPAVFGTIVALVVLLSFWGSPSKRRRSRHHAR